MTLLLNDYKSERIRRITSISELLLLDVLNIHKEGESGVVREGGVDPVFD